MTARESFLENCRDILARQSHVTINDAALDKFAETLKKSTFIPDWKDYISAEANSQDAYDFKRAFYEMAMIIANQGGFIYEDEDGQAKKWQVNGSGARAMVEKMAEIRAAGALPFYDVAPGDVEAKIGLLLHDTPFAKERLDIFSEFADPARHRQVMDLLDSAFDGEKYRLDISFAQKLAAILPAGFGGDSLMKKSILTCLMATANAHHHGVKGDISDMTIAADYILPQVLNADHVGILQFSPELTEKLQKKQSFAENAEEVTILRAAAVIACDKLAKKSGLNAQDIDGALWLAGRKLQNARPHMMCYTMWF